MAKRGRRTADEKLAVALASGALVADAAKAAGVSESTVYNRLDDPAFRALLAETRQAIWTRACDRLADNAVLAAVKLGELLNAENEKVALAAARSILELGVRLRDQLDMAVRLA